MNCDEAQAVLDGYVDQELDLVTSLEMEAHLESCDACSRAYANRQALQSSLRAASLSYPAPPRLHSRVLGAVRRADVAAPDQDASSRRMPALPWLRGRPAIAALAAAFLAVGFLGWSVGRLSPVAPPEEGLTQQVFAGTVRSLMATDQGVEVRTSDRHTVKPWFAGKLDFSPPVQDFAAQGFPLVGARRDYVAGRPVAALVYRHGAHWINLYIWPSPSPSKVQEETYQGYHLSHWAGGGLQYWAMSDVNAPELRQFVRLIQSED